MGKRGKWKRGTAAVSYSSNDATDNVPCQIGILLSSLLYTDHFIFSYLGVYVLYLWCIRALSIKLDCTNVIKSVIMPIKKDVRWFKETRIIIV